MKYSKFTIALQIFALAMSLGYEASAVEGIRDIPTVFYPNHLSQVLCIKELGGCANTRDGGLPDTTIIAQYDQECRRRTLYRADAPAIQISEVTPHCMSVPFNWNAINQRTILTIRENTRTAGAPPNDAESLARLFDSNQIYDDGTVGGRLDAVLAATEHHRIKGLQEEIEFSDVGFFGDQNPNGRGYRDPHPSSRNQVGHFLTGVGLGFNPHKVAQMISLAGVPIASMRALLNAPESMSDEEVVAAMVVGHELAPDPVDSLNYIKMIAGFQLQFHRALENPHYVEFFRQAERALTEGQRPGTRGGDEIINMTAAFRFLRQIPLNVLWRGNSYQDLRLTLAGWHLGRMIRSGRFSNRAEIAQWLRNNLIHPPEDMVQTAFDLLENSGSTNPPCPN